MTGIRLKAYLVWLKMKHGLSILRLEQESQDKVKIFGKVNPEFEVMAEVIRDDTDDKSVPENKAQNLEVFFRGMNIEELMALRKFRVLTPQTDKHGQPMGQPFITLDAQYSKMLMRRKWEQGEKEGNESKKRMYEYIVKIEVQPGTEEMLQDPAHARVEEPNLATRRRFPKERTGIPSRGKDERGIVVLKMEPLDGKKKAKEPRPRALNYGITPKNLSENDPLQMFNARIVRITVIGRLTD